jgi:hypothetical protein
MKHTTIFETEEVVLFAKKASLAFAGASALAEYGILEKGQLLAVRRDSGMIVTRLDQGFEPIYFREG